MEKQEEQKQIDIIITLLCERKYKVFDIICMRLISYKVNREVLSLIELGDLISLAYVDLT